MTKVSKGSPFFQPKKVAQGARVRSGKAGKHKDKPKIGRGNYVKAPLLRDKLTKPRWMANAVVNNPGHTLAAGGLLGGGALLAEDKITKADDRKKNVAAGALVGAGGAHFARVGAEYGLKDIADRQLGKFTAHGKKGRYGPYKDGWEHKPLMNKYKRTAKGSPRAKAAMFDANFPKGVPSYTARKVGTVLSNPKVAAGVAVGGAVGGAGAGLAASKREVKKSSTSAFGVKH